MNKKFTFVDLFAGIGGFHLALKDLGGHCIMACEIDRNARKTYMANFDVVHFPDDIITDPLKNLVPYKEIDIVCAGFPCQAFSVAGKQGGLNDQRGKLFDHLALFLHDSQPKSFILENVPNLIKIYDGTIWRLILHVLNEIGYSVYFNILSASEYGLPTRRQRLYIVGIRKDILGNKEFNFPDKVPLKYNLSDIFEGKCNREIGLTLRVGGAGSGIKDRHNWDRYMVDGQVKTIELKHAIKMMGFPDDFKFPVSNRQAIRQLGNSVAVDVVKAIGKELLIILKKKRRL